LVVVKNPDDKIFVGITPLGSSADTQPNGGTNSNRNYSGGGEIIGAPNRAVVGGGGIVDSSRTANLSSGRPSVSIGEGRLTEDMSQRPSGRATLNQVRGLNQRPQSRESG
jgi:hypothetical protein